GHGGAVGLDVAEQRDRAGEGGLREAGPVVVHVLAAGGGEPGSGGGDAPGVLGGALERGEPRPPAVDRGEVRGDRLVAGLARERVQGGRERPGGLGRRRAAVSRPWASPPIARRR